jgi:hypothetical protein
VTGSYRVRHDSRGSRLTPHHATAGAPGNTQHTTEVECQVHVLCMGCTCCTSEASLSLVVQHGSLPTAWTHHGVGVVASVYRNAHSVIPITGDSDWATSLGIESQTQHQTGTAKQGPLACAADCEVSPICDCKNTSQQIKAAATSPFHCSPPCHSNSVPALLKAQHAEAALTRNSE